MTVADTRRALEDDLKYLVDTLPHRARIMALADAYATEKALAAHQDCCYLCLRGLRCVHRAALAALREKLEKGEE